jgi:threonine/homoserine/homoserine lactone efflux protein
MRICLTQPQQIKSQAIAKSSLWSSFWMGLLITLADQKATLFYLGFFPAFVDMTKITRLDTGIIIAIAIVAVGGVKVIYAAIAARAGLLVGDVLKEPLRDRLTKYLNFLAGCVMVAVGLFLLLKA